MTLTPDEYVRALKADGEALASAADGALDRPVPTCPLWTVADLVEHTGWVHRDKSQRVRRGGTEPPAVQYREQPKAPRDTLLEWYREGLADLAEILGATDPEAPAYSWAGDHRVAFWQRRMAQETLVHRFDAEAAVSRFTPIDLALAADGVDEFLKVFVPRNDEPYEGPQGEIVFASTDTADRWTVVPADELHVAVGGTDGDATVELPAADLLMVLWRRRPLDPAEVTGAEELVTAFLGWNDLD